MARLELNDPAQAFIGGAASGCDTFFQLGMMYSTGRSVNIDMVAAHKWFNIAAAKGHQSAAEYRQEVAREMSKDKIAAALRAAREWLRTH